MAKVFYQNQSIARLIQGLSDVIRFDQRPIAFAFLLLNSL